MKFILVYLVPPTQKIAKNVEKSSKIALLWGQFSRDWDRNRKIGPNGNICLSFSFINHQSFWLYLIHGRNANVIGKPGQKSKISNKSVGVNQNFFKSIFLDVFFDVDSKSFWVFAFGASGSEIWPFFWFWPLHREIFLSQFFKKWKKISQKWLLMGLSCSEFFTDHFSGVHFGLSGPTYA